MAGKILKHANGTPVSAQEAYDAFMNTRVLLADRLGTTYEALTMVWYDNNSAQTDPANVGYVKLDYIKTGASTLQAYGAHAGNSSLVPTQQG